MRVFEGEKRLDEIRAEIKKHLKKMRKRAGLTQNQVNEKLAFCSSRTYQKMEQGNVGTHFDSFLEVFHLFQGTDKDAAILFGNHPSEDVLDGGRDSSDAHLARLQKFTQQKYTIRYFDSMDKMKRLYVQFGDIIDNTFVPGTAKIGKKSNYTYECKLISPVDSPYVFLHLTSTSSLVDRALLVLPEIDLVVKKIKYGIGIMMSLSVDTQHCPTIQKFAILNDTYKTIDDRTLASYLVVKKEQISKYMLRIPDLKEINNRFSNALNPEEDDDENESSGQESD